MTTTNVLTRYRTFEAIYKGPTNTKGARIIIKDLRRNKSITVPYDYQYNNADDIAVAHLEKIGIKVDALAMRDRDVLLLTENFDTDLTK